MMEKRAVVLIVLCSQQRFVVLFRQNIQYSYQEEIGYVQLPQDHKPAVFIY